ncbi:MAG: 50S ribosomal protein L21 [Candidatus Limnocylindria bacterium]
MYAVVDSGGKQYRVEPGRTLVLDRLDAEAGATVTFDRVLLIGDEDSVTLGTPTVSGATVRGTVLEHGRGPKVIVFRFRPKAHYRRRTGHRSELTRVRIDEIATAEGAKARPKPTAKAAAPDKPSGKTKAAPSKTTAPTRAPRKAAGARKTKPESG